MAFQTPARVLLCLALSLPAAIAQTIVLTPSTTQLNAAGGSLTFTASIAYTSQPSTLGLTVGLPPGWSYVSGTSVSGASSEPAISPVSGSTGSIDWAFITVPATPVVFTFTTAYPASAVSPQQVTTSLIVRDGTGGPAIVTSGPPLTLPGAPITWNGAAGSWTDPAQWTPNIVPVNTTAAHYSASVAAGTATLASAVAVDNLLFTAGTITGPGSLTVTGPASTWTGGIFSGVGEFVIAPGAQLSASGNGTHSFNERTIRNQGTFIWLEGGALQSGNGGSFINSPGANFIDATTGTSGSLITNASGGAFTFANAGTFTKTTMSVTAVSVPFSNSGNLRLTAGTLQFTDSFVQNAGSLFVASGATARFDQGLNFAAGTLTGGGTIAANVTNSAFLSPGELLGTLTVTGNLTLLAGSVLSFDVGATHDILNVSGSATLGGTLLINFVNGAQNNILPTDSFTLLNASSISGSFANVASGMRLMSNSGNGSFLVTYSGTSLTLSNFDPVPEPATWALLLAGAGMVGWTALRRSAGRRPRTGVSSS